jgi:hypothetical protein
MSVLKQSGCPFSPEYAVFGSILHIKGYQHSMSKFIHLFLRVSGFSNTYLFGKIYSIFLHLNYRSKGFNLKSFLFIKDIFYTRIKLAVYDSSSGFVITLAVFTRSTNITIIARDPRIAGIMKIFS